MHIGAPARKAMFAAAVTRFVSVAMFTGVLCLASASRADERVVPEARIESTRGMALGTGARASAASTHAQADNASNLVVGPLYHMESFIGYQPSLKRVALGVALVDSMTSRLAAGASARMLLGDNRAGDNAGWEIKGGIGIPIVNMLSVGVSGRFVRYTLSDPNARPEKPVEMGEEPDQSFKLKAFSLDANFTLRPIPGLSLAGLAYNMIDTKSPLAPRMVGGSAAFSFGRSGFGLGGDVLVDLNSHKLFDGVKLQMGGGMEYLMEGRIPLRAGYLYDQGREQHAVTGGVGFVEQQVGVHLSLRQVVSGGNDTTLMGALQYFVQ